MPPIKSGRKPISSKPKFNPFLSNDDVFGNPLHIDPELQKELDEQGLVPRFVDANNIAKMGGYHAKGWVPYRRIRKESANIGLGDWKFGNDPEGIVRRGSLILAVKSKADAEKHRSYLRARAERYSGFDHDKAEELRKYAKENQVDTQVHEGFEDNE